MLRLSTSYAHGDASRACTLRHFAAFLLALFVLAPPMADGAVVGGGWGEAQVIGAGHPSRVAGSQLAADEAGNVFAVWAEQEGGRFSIFANRLPAGGSAWQSARPIEFDDTGDAADPQVAADGLGGASFIWRQFDGERDRVFSNSYTPGSGWQKAATIDGKAGGDALQPHLAAGAEGSFVAVWSSLNGSRRDIWAARLNSSDGWSAPMLLVAGASDARNPRVEADTAGHALAVWRQSDGARFHLWWSRFEPSAGWSPPEPLETDPLADSLAPQLAMSATGDAVVVWASLNETRYDVLASRVGSDRRWSAPTLLESESVWDALEPRVATGAGGDAVVLWQQFDGIRDNLWSSRFTPTTGWNGPELIEHDNAGSALFPSVAVDGEGIAHAVWRQFDGRRYAVLGNRYVPGVGWKSPSVLEEEESGNVSNPHVSVDGGGRAFAIWSNANSGKELIFVNRYVPVPSSAQSKGFLPGLEAVGVLGAVALAAAWGRTSLRSGGVPGIDRREGLHGPQDGVVTKDSSRRPPPR